MISIDKYAYRSKLKHTDPVQKVFFTLLTLAVCLWANHLIISTLIIFIMGGMTVFIGGTPLRFFMKLLLAPLSFLFIGVFTIAVNVSESKEGLLVAISFADTWIGFSKMGLQDAFHLIMRSLGAVSCLYFLSLSTPMVDLLGALHRLRLPNVLVEIMGLIYRFIFVLLETSDTIYHAQSCRLGYSSLSTGYRSLGSLASMLFIRSYMRSDALYTALEARGYEGELNVLEEAYTKNWRGYVVTFGINIFLVFLAILLK